MIRKDYGSNNSLFLSCQMGLSDVAFFMIKHTPLPNGNHPISSPIYTMGVADTLGLWRPWFFHKTNAAIILCTEKYPSVRFFEIYWLLINSILLMGEDYAGCPIHKLGPPKILTFRWPRFAVGSYASWQFLQDPFTQTHILTFVMK